LGSLGDALREGDPNNPKLRPFQTAQTHSATPWIPPPKFRQRNDKPRDLRKEKQRRPEFLLTHHTSDQLPLCQHVDPTRTAKPIRRAPPRPFSPSRHRLADDDDVRQAVRAQTTMASVGDDAPLLGGGGKAAVWRERCPGCRQQRRVQASDGIPYADFLYVWIACLCACMNII
jgi:hypothetical protein